MIPRQLAAPMAAPRVLVIGSINEDLVIHTDRLPGPGETVTGDGLERFGGGKGANQAVAARAFGGEVLFVGAVGEDGLGARAVARLEASGLDTDRVARLPDAATGVALIVVDRNGENQIAVASGANARLDEARVEAALKTLDLSGCVLLVNLEIPDGAIFAAARKAAAEGAPIVVNPAPARPLSDHLLDLGPVLTPNRREVEALSGIAEPEEGARQLARRTGNAVVVTLGRDGALVARGGRVSAHPAYDVDPVDTTGAGDVFSGVLAACLASGMGVSEGVDWAGAAAAVHVTTPGARATNLTRRRVSEMRESR